MATMTCAVTEAETCSDFGSFVALVAECVSDISDCDSRL